LMQSATWADYEDAFGRLLAKARASLDISSVVFGDVYPDANRLWAETVSTRCGLMAIEPLWGEPTEVLVREFIATRSTAIITTVRDAFLDDSYLGKCITSDIIADFIDRGIDPCGERGEFHTFVTQCGGSGISIPFKMGNIHRVDGCSTIDLVLADNNSIHVQC